MWIFVPRELPCWATGTGAVCLLPRQESWRGCFGSLVRPQALSHLWIAGKEAHSLGKVFFGGRFLVWFRDTAWPGRLMVRVKALTLWLICRGTQGNQSFACHFLVFHLGKVGVGFWGALSYPWKVAS